MVSNQQRRANLTKAKAKVRKSTGGFLVTRRVGGGITATVKGIKRPITPQQKSQAESASKVVIRDAQRSEARKSVGSIRRVFTRLEKNPITKRLERVTVFVGASGKKASFPEKGLTFSGRQKFGGLASREVPVTPAIAKAQIKRLRRQGTKRAEQQIKRIEKTLEKQAVSQRKFFIGRIPERGAKVKTFRQLTQKEKAQLLPSDNILRQIPLKKRESTIKRILNTILEIPRGLGKGIEAQRKGLAFSPRIARNLVKSVIQMTALTIELSKIKKTGKVRPKGLRILEKTRDQLLAENKNLRPLIKDSKEALKLLNSQEARMVNTFLGISLLTVGAGAIGGITAIVIDTGLTISFSVTTGKQILNTIRSPTPENITRSVLVAIPTLLGVIGTVRGVKNFKVTSKNLNSSQKSLNRLLKSNRKKIARARKLRQPKTVKKLKFQNKALDQALKEAAFLLKQRKLLAAKKITSAQYQKFVAKLKRSYNKGVHKDVFSGKETKTFFQRLKDITPKRKIRLTKEKLRLIKRLRKKELKASANIKARDKLVSEIQTGKIKLTSKVRASIRKILRKEFIGKESIKPLKIPEDFFSKIKGRTVIGKVKRQLTRLKRKQFKSKTASLARDRLLSEIRSGKIKLTANVRASIRKLIRKDIIGKDSIKPLKIPKSAFDRIRSNVEIGRVKKQLTRLRRKEFKTRSAEIARDKLIKELQTGKIKLTPKVRASIRKIFRRELIGKESIRPLKLQDQSIQTLISNLEKFRKSVRKNLSGKLEIRKITKDAIKIVRERNLIKKAKVKIKKSPFSPSERMKTIKKLNTADRKIQVLQNEMKTKGQKQIILLKTKEIQKIKIKAKQIAKTRSISASQQKFKLLNKVLIKSLSKLRIMQSLSSALGLKLKSKQINAQIAQVKSIQKSAVKAVPKIKVAVKAIPKSKVATKQAQKIIKSVAQSQSVSVAQTQSLAQQLFRLSKTQLKTTLKKIIKSPKNISQQLSKRKLTKKEIIAIARRLRGFIFQADLISRLFGIRATKSQKRRLLKVGRVFSGLERRPLISQAEIIRRVKQALK